MQGAAFPTQKSTEGKWEENREGTEKKREEEKGEGKE